MAKKYGIAVDISSCIGCGVCVVACKQEHGLTPNTDDVPGTRGVAWNQVLSTLEGTYPDLSMHYLYQQCMHCENPPCVAACPVNGALSKRDDGIVLVNKDKCDGCKGRQGGPRCVPACPYGAIQLNSQKGVAEACTMCAHLVDAGREPACVKACIGGALIFGDLNDPESKISKALKAAGKRVFVLKPEKGTNPTIKYIKPQEVSLERVTDLDKATLMYGYRK